MLHERISKHDDDDDDDDDDGDEETSYNDLSTGPVF
jgi:hypothetical protein